jgi:hypothetical protein
MSLFLRRVAVLVPYVAVILGLFLAHSAWAALLGYHVGMVLMLSLAGAWPQVRPLLTPVPGRWMALMLLAGLLSGLGLYITWPSFGIVPNLGVMLSLLGLNAASWPLFIFYFVLVNPWLEECYWRGWLGDPSSLLLAGDAWFAGFHLLVLAPFVPWPSLIFAFIVLGATSWFWRQIVHHSNSLLPAGLFHLAADASIFIAIYVHTN